MKCASTYPSPVCKQLHRLPTRNRRNRLDCGRTWFPRSSVVTRAAPAVGYAALERRGSRSHAGAWERENPMLSGIRWVTMAPQPNLCCSSCEGPLGAELSLSTVKLVTVT